MLMMVATQYPGCWVLILICAWMVLTLSNRLAKKVNEIDSLMSSYFLGGADISSPMICSSRAGCVLMAT